MSLALEALPLFENLSGEAYQALMNVAQTRKADRGGHLFHRGEAAGHLFVIRSGTVRLYRETPDGRVAGLCMAMAGQTLAEDECLNNLGQYTASAQAMDEVHILAFPRSLLRMALTAYPQIALNLLRQTARQVSYARRDRDHLLTLKASQRLGCLLMHLCAGKAGVECGFSLPYTKTALASGLGMEPETFSRALGQLKALGLGLRRGEGHLSQPEALESHVCGSCSLSEDCEVRAKFMVDEVAPLRRVGL